MSYSKYESTFKQSTWYNPTSETLYARIWVGPESQKEPWAKCEFPPGEETTLPSDFDDAIQTVDKNGIIVSGKVPQIVKVGRKYNLHPALDANAAARQQAFRDAQTALAARAVNEQAAILAAGEMQMHEDRQKKDNVVDELARRTLKEKADKK